MVSSFDRLLYSGIPYKRSISDPSIRALAPRISAAAVTTCKAIVVAVSFAIADVMVKSSPLSTNQQAFQVINLATSILDAISASE